jgi:phospholipase C
MRRRGFLKAGAGAAGAAALGATGAACAPAPGELVRRGPGPEAGIEHIVVVMMENRSYDHFLSWLPGGDGRAEDLTYLDDHGVAHTPYRFPNWAGCGFEDPDHSREGGLRQLHDGVCDGFLFESPDLFPIGYHTSDQLAFWSRAAPAWTVCDRYFSAFMGPTWPNRFYQHCAQSLLDHNALQPFGGRTIWDRLVDAGLEGRYYFSDAPFAALLGVRHLLVSRTFDQFLADAAQGRLGHVSFVDPRFVLSGPIGTSGDYHPLSDIRFGDQFLHRVYEAVTRSPNWERTVLVVNFDEWGGFFDHVAPTVAPDLRPAFGLRGFRVPCLVASPLARRGHVAHGEYDHTSVLKMIEWAFDLEPLTPRDAAANNLADVLDLGSSPDASAPHWEIEPFVPENCISGFVNEIWDRLLAFARAQGWPV